VTCDVIKEFYEDGVSYLELRSTPRANEANSMWRILIDSLVPGASIVGERTHITYGCT
jgi:hypothetical protein